MHTGLVRRPHGCHRKQQRGLGSSLKQTVSEQASGGLWQKPATKRNGRDIRTRPPSAYEHWVALAELITDYSFNRMSNQGVRAQGRFEKTTRGQRARRLKRSLIIRRAVSIYYQNGTRKIIRKIADRLVDNYISGGSQ